ncbi:MAG TPA: heparan-alpha-glucosaminide N-acetyltransferase [Rubrivivax sp.]|nr:heparan-alpha-glucosaminide N-acetyltransferase [Rubrivivax sp.]
MNAAPAPRPDRCDGLDALRGIAMVWMLVFHFCYDLNLYGYIEPRQAFTRDPFWTVQRTCIVSLFVFCAGFGQALALHAGQLWRQFWRRWAQIAGCALLVSVGSATMFPRSWIWFGVLHGIAVMLIVCRLAAPLRGWLWLAGAIALILPWAVRLPLFDTPALLWLGLPSRRPVTEDWVPVLPWLGVMFWGLASGQWLLRRRSPLLLGRVPLTFLPLAALGRWSLSFYMLHQPVLIGAILGGRHLGWW